MPLTPHQAKYLAYELTRRGPANSIEKFAGTLADAKVDMNPHQVEAALFAFKSPLSKGAILADEVGLGKTIEAGIVLSQFWAEGKNRILLLVPASLRKQWQNELTDKFYLPSSILEGPSFNKARKAGVSNPFDTLSTGAPEIIISSHPFAAGKDEFLMRTPWDLVVIDEAHRLRNVHKADNINARKLRTALHNSRKILLTATPLQNNLLELYGLVSFIDEHAFGDKKAFSTQYNRSQTDDSYAELKSRLAPFCYRTLRRQVTEYIRYTSRSAITQDFTPTAEEVALYDLVSEYLQRDDLQALPAGQRQLITLVLRKLLASSSFAIAGALDSMHRRLTRTLRADDQSREKSLVEELDEDTDGGFSEDAEEWEDDPAAPGFLSIEDRAALEAEVHELACFRDQAISIQENAKGEALLIALEKGFTAMRANGANDKAIIFTESRRTQEYLVRRLTAAGYGDDLVLFNGTNGDPATREIYENWKQINQGTDRVSGSRSADVRQALVEHFKDSARIMIATEAAAEGINLQFCSLVINYDLPWNPQRIEQRIGRCHRYGQNHDVVVINFLNRANAADQRVHELLSDKLRLFDGLFGSSDEVLGILESGVDFEKRIHAIYQKCRHTDEIQSSFDALQKELETEIKAKLSDTRTSLLENFDSEVADKLRHNKIDGERYLNKIQSGLWTITRHILNDRAMFDPVSHTFILSNPPYPGIEIPRGRYELITGKEDPQDAHRYRLHHPLAQAVIREAKDASTPVAHLTFDYSGSPGKSVNLESLVGSRGSLAARVLTITTGIKPAPQTHEDIVILAATQEDGTELSDHVIHLLLALPATVGTSPGGNSPMILTSILDRGKNASLAGIEQRNMELFQQETDKLDHWAEDQRRAQKGKLDDIDIQSKVLRKQVRESSSLPEKLNLHKELRALERLRIDAWKSFDEKSRGIDEERDRIESEAVRLLAHSVSEEQLFTITWQLQ
jgi:superfamily II DNA or RNA helicase